MIRQARTYLLGAVSGTVVIAAAVVAFVVVVSLQAVGDWPIAGLALRGANSAAVAPARPVAKSTPAAATGVVEKRRPGAESRGAGRHDGRRSHGKPPPSVPGPGGSAPGNGGSTQPGSPGGAASATGAPSGGADPPGRGEGGDSPSRAAGGVVDGVVSGADKAIAGALGGGGAGGTAEGAVDKAAGPGSTAGHAADNAAGAVGGLPK